MSNYAGYNDVLTIEELKYVYGEEFDNHFISNLDIFKGKKSIPVIKGQSEVSSSSTELDKKTSPNILSVLSGVDVTKYADGLAKFIVKRFKQDMNEIFFQKMKKEMADNEELQVLFPKTYEELKLIDQNIYDINLFLTSLRERMEEDLRQIFSHANDLMETDKYRLKFKDNPVLGAFLGTVFQVIHGVTQGEHAGMIIENLTFSDAYDKKDDGKNIKAAMQTLRLFSIGLRADTTKETYWIHGKDNVQKLFEGDALAAKIWLGLMYQLAENDKDKPITFADTTLAAKINLWADNTDYFYDTRQYLTTFYNKALAIQDNYVQLKKGKEEKPVVDNWQNYINCYESIIELVEHAPKIIELFDKNEAMSQNWYQGIKIAKGLLTLKVEVEARKYPAAVQHIAALFKALDMRAKFINEDTIKRLGSCIIYENANKQKPLRRFVDIDELKSKFADKDSIKSITILKSEAKEKEIKECKKDNATKILIEPNYDWVNEFVRYASFAASMALTKNSDEVEALLTTTTLPSGSVSRKSKGVSLMVNTYLSTIYGFYLKKENERTDLSQGFAISAPIGLSLNMGIYKKREKEYWENSLPRNFQAFVSVFDVGTLVNTRLVNDTIQVPKITLGNIFAPGLYFKLGGWFNLPITLGVGVQKLPNLILKGDKQIIIPTATRYSISLSWDIPMWNIKHWRN